MPRDNTSFPSAAQAALLLIAGFLLEYVVTLALYDFRNVLGITSTQLGVLARVLANGVLIVGVLHMRGSTHRELLHESSTPPVLTFLFIVPPVLLLVPLIVLLDGVMANVLEAIFPVSAWEERAFAGMVADSLPSLVATCVLAPVLEEMLFRGILLRSFLDRYPRGLAIGYSALYFGVAHMNIYQFMLAFLLGLLLGWLFERCRSLVPCVALHAAVNGTVVAWGMSNASEASRNVPFDPSAGAWVGAAVAAAIGAFALRRLLASRERKAQSAA